MGKISVHFQLISFHVGDLDLLWDVMEKGEINIEPSIKYVCT